jgi:DNA-binding NtrC family response regulator
VKDGQAYGGWLSPLKTALEREAIFIKDKADVVIIDDDASVRWLLKEMLLVAGISHLAAASGQEGLRLVSECKPRLVIIDVKLGGDERLRRRPQD